MDWKKITTELAESYGSTERLARLALCPERTIKRIMEGKAEPTYSVGDRLIRMHDSMTGRWT